MWNHIRPGDRLPGDAGPRPCSDSLIVEGSGLARRFWPLLRLRQAFSYVVTHDTPTPPHRRPTAVRLLRSSRGAGPNLLPYTLWSVLEKAAMDGKPWRTMVFCYQDRFF